MEFTLLWAALAGVGAMWMTDRYLNANDRHFDDLLSAALVGLLVGRLAAMIGGGSYPWEHPGLIPLVRAGVHPGWASFAALGWLGFRFRSEPLILASMSVPALIGLGGWEAGCLFRSACGGIIVGTSPFPIGVVAGLAFIGAGFIMHRVPSVRKPGAALLAAGLIRAASEPFRSALDHSIVGWYLAGAVVGLLITTRIHPPRIGTE